MRLRRHRICTAIGEKSVIIIITIITMINKKPKNGHVNKLIAVLHRRDGYPVCVRDKLRPVFVGKKTTSLRVISLLRTRGPRARGTARRIFPSAATAAGPLACARRSCRVPRVGVFPRLYLLK